MVALKMWGASLQVQRLVLLCDNDNSVNAVTSGRSRSPGMQLCQRERWFFSAFGDFELIGIHIPGRTNTLTTLAVGTPYSQERFFDLTAWLNIPPTGFPLAL